MKPNVEELIWPAVNADELSPEELYKVISEGFCTLVTSTSARS